MQIPDILIQAASLAPSSCPVQEAPPLPWTHPSPRPVLPLKPHLCSLPPASSLSIAASSLLLPSPPHCIKLIFLTVIVSHHTHAQKLSEHCIALNGEVLGS